MIQSFTIKEAKVKKLKISMDNMKKMVETYRGILGSKFWQICKSLQFFTRRALKIQQKLLEQYFGDLS